MFVLMSRLTIFIEGRVPAISNPGVWCWPRHLLPTVFKKKTRRRSPSLRVPPAPAVARSRPL